MQVLVLSHDDVTDLLSVAECIPLMRDTLTVLSSGAGHQPLRTVIAPPGQPGFLGLMPAFVSASKPVLGVKLLGIFGANPAVGKDAHQGAVILLDPQTGEVRAVVNASAITAARTGHGTWVDF